MQDRLWCLTGEIYLQAVQPFSYSFNFKRPEHFINHVLEARLQSSGSAGPPKWEPHSRIGVYLGHSPFHTVNMSLVWNPTTGRVIPQYHVVFDDDFTTVTYMEAGTLPPNWKELIKHSSEMDTTEMYLRQTLG